MVHPVMKEFFVWVNSEECIDVWMCIMDCAVSGLDLGQRGNLY
jgi:Fe-S-cluster-containing hydrogenase component 2